MRLIRQLLPRTVVVLGLVSLLNDASSEMIAPLLPVFLTATLGAGPAVVGLIEGSAEAISSILKLVSGHLADRGWSRKGLVVGGYTVSNSVRPLIGLALAWPSVLALRFFDRIGKGLRTAPRDAMLAASVDARIRGRAFGFHRALDHGGAMLGPLIAFALLQSQVEMREVFLWSAVPGAAVLCLLLFGLKSAPRIALPRAAPLRWRLLDGRVRAMLLASGLLALATAPEAFLVLWAGQRGLKLAWIPLIWAAAHAVKAIVAAPAGMLSDRIGRPQVMLLGWSARVVVLILLALWQDGAPLVWVLFLTYAGTLAFSEGAERALIGDYVAEQYKATAFGLYHLICGIAALPGAIIFGLLWQRFGMPTAFLSAAALSAVAAAALLTLVRSTTP